MVTEFVKIDGVKLWERGFFSINMDSGLRISPVIGNVTPQFDYAINNKEAYLIGKTYEPISFPMMFTTQTGTWSEDERAEFLSLIDNDNLIELSFEGDEKRVYFVTLQGAVTFSSNDGFSGFYSLEFVSNYPYAFSEERSLTVNVNASSTFSIFNEGDIVTAPEVNITKLTSTGGVSFSIKNNKYPVTTQSFLLVEIYNAEEVYVNNANGEIISSLPNVYRYKDWNNKKLELEPGLNEITITGDSLVSIKYRYIYRR